MIDRRKFLAGALLGGAATAAGFTEIESTTRAGAQSAVSTASGVNTSNFPKGPAGFINTPLLDVDEAARIIVVGLNNPLISQNLNLHVPVGTRITRQDPNKDISDLMLGDLLAMGLRWPADYSSVTIDWICANYVAGVVQAVSVTDTAMTARKMYGPNQSQPTNWSTLQNVTVTIGPSTVVEDASGHVIPNFSGLAPGRQFHFTASGDRPSPTTATGILVQLLL